MRAKVGIGFLLKLSNAVKVDVVPEVRCFGKAVSLGKAEYPFAKKLCEFDRDCLVEL